MKIITRGNYFRKEYQMQDNTTITGGNFVLCKVYTNGFQLIIEGGNVRGLYIDDVKQDSFVMRTYNALPAAVEVLAAAEEKGGTDGRAAWLNGFVEQVLGAGTAVAYAAVEPAYEAWRVANDNFVEWNMLYNFILGFMPDGWTWADLRDYIQSYDLATWSGEETILDQEYS